MSGSSYVYYDGDSGVVRYAISGASSIAYSKSYQGAHWDSVFSDVKTGQMYRLAGSNSASVGASGTFSTLQCLDADGSTTASVSLSASQTMGSQYVLYAGYGYAAFKDSSNDWKLLTLNGCAGAVSVSSLGTDVSSHTVAGCERTRQNGVLESSNGATVWSIIYACGGGNFCRKSIPSGTGSVAYALGSTYHSDTCSLVLDIVHNQWLWQSVCLWML